MRSFLALVGSALLLAGCGGAAAAPRTAQELNVPTAAPHWPVEDCDEHSHAIFDFANVAASKPTREEAAAAYMGDGDRIVPRIPRGEHRRLQWLVVSEDEEIQAALTVWESPQGYLVDSVETCAG